jgi:hypothetical protein
VERGGLDGPCIPAAYGYADVGKEGIDAEPGDVHEGEVESNSRSELDMPLPRPIELSGAP